jgi:hypothetical protein
MAPSFFHPNLAIMGIDEKFKAGSDVLQGDCYPDRKNTDLILKAEGEVCLIDQGNFGIRSNGKNNLLLPCNLPEKLKAEGRKIIFSGQVKEMQPTEMWAGHPFVLTEVEEK